MKTPKKDIPNHTISGLKISASENKPKIINSKLRPKTNNLETRRVFIKKLGTITIPAILLPSMLACEDELPDTFLTEKEYVLTPSHLGSTMDIIAIEKGAKIISANTDCTIKVWDNNNQSLLKTITFDNPVYGICVDSSEEIMIVTHYNIEQVTIMSVKDLTISKYIDIGVKPHSCSLSPDGSKFAVEKGGKIYVYLISSGELINTISSDLYDLIFKKILFLGDSDRIAGINYDDVGIWNVHTGELLTSFPLPWKMMFTCITLSRDGKTLICGNKKGFQAFNTDSYELEFQYNPGGGSTTNSDNIEFSPDDNYIYMSTGHTIVTFNRNTGEKLNSVSTGTSYMKHYTCFENNKIAAAINVSSVKSDFIFSFVGVWDCDTGSLLNSYKDESLEVSFTEEQQEQHLDTSCKCDIVCNCDQVCDCLGVCTCDTACNSHDPCPSHRVPNCNCESVGQCNCYSVCMINY